MTTGNTTTPSPIEAYRAQTDRAEKLANFLARFAPAYGESCDLSGRTAVDDETPRDILDARDHAVRAAFDALRVIAKNS